MAEDSSRVGCAARTFSDVKYGTEGDSGNNVYGISVAIISPVGIIGAGEWCTAGSTHVKRGEFPSGRKYRFHGEVLCALRCDRGVSVSSDQDVAVL